MEFIERTLYKNDACEIYRLENPKMLIAGFLLKENMVSIETAKVCNKYAHHFSKANEKCRIWVDVSECMGAGITVINEELNLVKEMDQLDKTQVEKITFVCGPAGAKILPIIMKARKKRTTPFQIFDNHEKAWEYCIQ